MSRALLRRLEALERERDAERDRPLSWADVMDGAMRHEAMLAALPPAEREAKEAARVAADRARWARALSGRMTAAEVDAAFPPCGDGPLTRASVTAWGLAPFRRAALVNRSRRERGLPAGCDGRHPDWAAELARLGLGEPCGTDVPMRSG